MHHRVRQIGEERLRLVRADELHRLLRVVAREQGLIGGTRDEIRAKLEAKLSDAFDRVWDLAEERNVTLRMGALVAGIREVSDALEARGIFP